ncbi:uncharacterized protein FOMMEDRAFT_156885 [Fomitiporia mediterranea MF3/22]|uniref:uncharacterized protein n=1 Tax=Fomitiporia mediterranea (strain MF3/22) TaxID=694068 RepID=UPI00044087A9|nr:uncharacterized protein FOMMEDRAFT_156885 [Fomitiporia mediterranea MF3/22]EJD03475.1 hypothetical protein FOMMEDRAFT_156885 [Fomitiporia mediterranea MF3/22]
MDASTTVCLMIAPIHHSLISPPALNCSHRGLSIHPLSLPFFCSCPLHPAAHLACTAFHYTAFAGFLGPSRRPHASTRIPVVTITSTVCPINALPVPLSVCHASENANLNIQPTLASNQIMVLTTMTTKDQGSQVLDARLQFGHEW